MRVAGKLLVTLMFMAALLAGCVTGDDVEAPGEEDDVPVEQGMGSIRGTILTVNLDSVEGAQVRLVQDDEPVTQTSTDADGSYRIDNVEPGDYRLQVTAVCCRENVAMVAVMEGETTTADLQLEPWTDDDLERPRIERYEWTGFLSCTVRAVAGADVCAIIEIAGNEVGHENATDNDFLYVWEIRRGLKTVVGGMQWQAPGASLGDELALLMEVADRPNAPPLYTRQDGPSPLEWRVEAGYVEANFDEEDGSGHNIHQYDFNNIEDSQELMYRIFAGGLVNVVYQQQFTVYWDLYYWAPAPPGASALPDV